MNVGYGCNIFYMLKDAKNLLEKEVARFSQKLSRSLSLLGAITISNTPPFLLSKEGTVMQSFSDGVKHPNVVFLKHHCTSLYHLRL